MIYYKMKLTLIIFFTLSFLFAGNISNAQRLNNDEKINSLLAHCDSEKNNIMLAAMDNGATLRKLSFEGLQFAPADDAKHRSQFYYYLANGFLFQNPTNVDSVSFYFLKSFEEAKKAKSSALIANAAISMMHIGFEMQNNAQTETYKNIIQSIADTAKDKVVLQNVYAALGTYYQQKSYYNSAQDYFLKSITLQQQTTEHWSTKDTTDFANRCHTLAQLYVKTSKFDKALSALNMGRPYSTSSYLIDMRYKFLLIDIFSKTGNIDSALYYLNTYVNPVTEKFKNRSAIPDFIIFSNLSVSRYYLDKNEYKQAWPYLQKLNAYPAEKIQFFESYQLQKTTARYYEQTGNFSKAVSLLTQALPLAQQFSKEDYTDILKYLAVAYQGLGNLQQALQFYKEYNESLDSLTKEKLSSNFADQETRYETSQKEHRITSLNKENKLNALQLQNAARTKWLLILGLVALGIIALLFYFIYRNREKLNKQLNIQKAALQTLNTQLSTANDTKAKLFGIISHDLRSPVSRLAQLMQLQKEHPEILNEETKQKHEDSIKKATENVLETMEDLLMWSKSQMQQFTPENKRVNINNVVAKEADLLHTGMEEKNIVLYNQLPENYIQTTDENFIAVIIRNLLQNAIKYSDIKTKIYITANNNELSIINTSMHANADVLNAHLNNMQVNSKASGLGLQIVSDLAAQLKLKIFFEKQDDQNLTAIIQFKS